MRFSGVHSGVVRGRDALAHPRAMQRYLDAAKKLSAASLAKKTSTETSKLEQAAVQCRSLIGKWVVALKFLFLRTESVSERETTIKKNLEAAKKFGTALDDVLKPRTQTDFTSGPLPELHKITDQKVLYEVAVRLHHFETGKSEDPEIEALLKADNLDIITLTAEAALPRSEAGKFYRHPKKEDSKFPGAKEFQNAVRELKTRIESGKPRDPTFDGKYAECARLCTTTVSAVLNFAKAKDTKDQDDSITKHCSQIFPGSDCQITRSTTGKVTGVKVIFGNCTLDFSPETSSRATRA